MGALVQRDDFDGWTQLTLDRPDNLNALTVEMFTELRRHVLARLARRGQVFFGRPRSRRHDRRRRSRPHRVGRYVFARESIDEDIAALVGRVIANSALRHLANKRLLEATDADPLDVGLHVGPDMADRIAAFSGKRG